MATLLPGLNSGAFAAAVEIFGKDYYNDANGKQGLAAPFPAHLA